MSAQLRRTHLLAPGEALLLMRPDPDTETGAGTPGVIKLADRLEEFARATGLSDDEVYSSPLTSVPLPIYTRAGNEGQRRWAGTEPTMMWHPLMWLPARVSTPYMFTEADGDERLESPDEWAIRVCLELTASGLYDPETGGWIDVLALFDLDITEPGVQHRIRAWLQGAPDAALDAIDLAPYLDSPEATDWAAQAAHGIYEDVVASSWSLVASDLWAIAAGMNDPAAPEEQVAQVTADVVRLAQTLIPEAVVDVNVTLADRVGDLTEGDATENLDELLSVLDLVARSYAEALEELEELANSA